MARYNGQWRGNDATTTISWASGSQTSTMSVEIPVGFSGMNKSTAGEEVDSNHIERGCQESNHLKHHAKSEKSFEIV